MTTHDVLPVTTSVTGLGAVSGATTGAAAPLLAVRDLAVSFTQYDRGLRRREVPAVVDMSLAVHAGEVVALVGASGAGKSLLGHAVLGLLPPNATQTGTIAWRGEEVDTAARRRLAGHGVALLPQSLSHLDPSASVGAQVRRAARLAGVARREARRVATEALLAQGLDASVLRLHTHELSGGMGRRVLTAMALLGDPALVIADEPTPGLAPESVTAVLQRLRRLADEGRGVLLITHEVGEALTVADRVVVVERGRTLEEAPASAFSGDGSALAHPYSRALWRALPQNGFALPDTLPEPLPTLTEVAC